MMDEPATARARAGSIPSGTSTAGATGTTGAPCTRSIRLVKDGHPLARPDVHALRRPLTRLGIGLDRCHRQTQGDDIDVDAAVEARVETLAGSAPDEAVYLDNLRRRRDLAVLVLLDVSGSVAEAGTFGHTVHEQQRAAAAALTVALHELGDRVALYAFQSQGRSAVHLLPVKRFDDSLDALVMQRLGSLTPGAYSRLGAAIRHGTSVITEKAGTSRRLLVVLSDGLAYDHGYERDLRRRRCAPRAGRGPPSGHRLPVPDDRRGHRHRRTSQGLRQRRARVDTQAQATGRRHRAAVPCRAAHRGPASPRCRSEPSLEPNICSALGCSKRMPRKETMPVKPPRPYYVPVANEEQVFKAAFRQGLSVVLKGPTGCGKTRFVEAMAHDLDRPLVTVSCHDDLTTADLVGRYPAARRRHRMGRRPADTCGARRRDLLSRRGRGGPPGHHGGAASAGRSPAAAADRAARG